MIQIHTENYLYDQEAKHFHQQIQKIQYFHLIIGKLIKNFYLLQNASSTASSISFLSNPDVMSRKNKSIVRFNRFLRLIKSIKYF